MPLMKCKS